MFVPPALRAGTSRRDVPTLRIASLVAFVLALQLASAQSTNTIPAQPAESADTNAPSRSKIIDPSDGWLDVSEFLDTAYGFIPVVSPITEPAVGYGGAGGLIFIDRKPPNPDGSFQKPNMAMLGGAGTENGTWAGFAGHIGSWLDGKLETQVVFLRASVNLDFFGVGEGSLNDQPVGYNLEPTGGMADVRVRLGDSPLRAGLRYVFASTKVSFDGGTLPPQIDPIERNSQVGGFTPMLTYDSRNGTFTPTKGIFAQAGVGVYNEIFASDFNYETVNLLGLGYLPVSTNFTIGAKVKAKFSFDDVPFYARPYISLRGVAVLRYLGEHAAETEIEARWQFWRRFSLVGFAGAGIAWNNFDRFQNEQSVVTGGAGFRYELARKYGLHMGVDVAFGPDDPVVYIQFGSAWFQP